MKKQFQSLTEKGRWLIATLTLLFTLGIGQMWAAYDVPNGEITLSQKVNNGGRFNVEASGLYHFRPSSGYSWDSGIKTQSNQGGVVFYLDESTEIEVTINHKESKNAHTVTVHVYSIPESEYKQFDDNKAGASESNRTFSTGPSTSTDNSFTISITAETKNFTGKKTLSAGYYAVVPTGSKSKTIFTKIKFTPSCSATAPGNISKGALNAGVLTLNAAGSPATNNVWYWQTSATGTSQTNSGTSFNVSAEGTYYVRSLYDNDCWSAAKSITITATDLVSNYTVKYMDGTTELGSEAVEVGEHPTGSGITTPTKDCYTFAGWDPALSGVSGSDGDEIEVNATWTPKYASTLDFAAVTTAGTTGSNPIGTFLASGNMVASNLGSNSGWETSTAKSGFIGYKVKNTNAVIKFLVKAGKEVEITLGSVGAAAKLNKGGVESEIAKKSGDNEQTVIPAFVAESDMLVTITTNASSNSTVTLKKISIVDPAPKYTVTYALNGATGTTPTEVDHKAGEKFNLHDGATGITAPANKTFVNWKDQDDNEFAGGAEYTMPGENVTLTAQWAGDVYTVKFMDGETVLDTKVVEVGSHPADIEHPTKPLYTFAAWQLSGSDVVLDNVNGTKDATVILTARWAVAYASNVNFKEAATQALGVETALNTYHYASDAGDISFEEKGLKIKTNAARFYFNVAPGKVAEIKFGNISGATYSVDGGAAETLSTSQLKATYSASAQSCVMTMTTAAYNIVEKVTIHDPYQVTFDANEGDPVASQYGYPSITLPSASKGTDSFLGWFIGEDKIGEAGDSYTPTANVELVAHWEAISTDARLSSITFSSDAGTLVPAWNMELTEYTYTMPYGTTAIPTITGATSVNANAQDPIIGEAATAWGGSQTIKGVAQSGDKKTYTITMLQAPKDGVCLIKGNVGNNTFVIDEEASLLSGTPSKNNVKSESSTYETLTGWKFNSRPAHLGLTLSEGTFQEGDVVEVFVTSEANGGGTTHKMRVFDAADATPAHVLAESAADMVQGANRLVLPATSTSSLYLHRGASGADYENWNPYVAYFAVYRPMNPMLTAMTIDGRTVTINEDAKTATVTIPYESDLANLTIAKTIIWNAPAATNSIVVNDGSAWVIGENTYKLTDKDGDATTYTITVARDVLKHTVSFNTHGGSAVASVEVEHNAYLTAVPNDPSKEDYIFQYWSLTDGGEEVDVTTVQINEDKEFHAVWVSDGGIKLLDGSTVNHTNFITAVTATETVEFKGNTVNYAKFSGTCGSVNNVKDLTKVIAYNATTNKTKIRISAHNNSTSGRNILVKGLVEGASAAVDLATIALGNKEDKVSDWIEFDNAANRTIYIMVGSSAGDVYFTQVKVIESGETPMKQVGEVGYSLNLNKGRFFGLANTDLAFEGLNARLSGDYTALNSGYAKLNATSMSFTVAAPMLLKVTTNNNKTYYVTKGAAGTDNETAKAGLSEFDLTAGTWYITAAASEVQFTNIEFAMPKAAKPVVAAMDDVEYCQGSAIDELAVSATVSDGGTMLYQWYKDNEIIAGAEAETYQPTADGEYYVEVVNTKTGYQNSDAVQSNTITVTGYAATVLSGTTGAENWPGANVTISVTASGKNLHYAWYTCDDAMGTNPVAVAPAVDAAELNVTIAAADTYYKVVVSGDCGSALEAIITVVARQAVELQDVTGNMTWDFSKANDGTAAGSNLCNDEVLANVHGIVNNSDFKSDNIKATANKFSSGKLQASMIMFHTTVGGIVTVVFSHTGNNKTDGRALVVNGTYQSELSHNQTAMTYKCYVPAGDVVLTSTTGDGGAMLNFTSVDFKAKAEADYTRNVSNNIGTLCVDHNVLVGGAMGATFYQIASRNELYNDKIDFEEVLPNEELKAGEPYIFHSNTGKIELFYGETVATEPVAVRGMIGSFVNTTLDITEENKSSIMYIAQNKLWNCEDLVVSDLEVVANRAYIVMSDVPTYAEYQEALQQQQNPAPRRRVTLGRNAEQVATGIGEVQGDKVQSTKVLIDGHIYILRGEKMFDAKGQLVK